MRSYFLLICTSLFIFFPGEKVLAYEECHIPGCNHDNLNNCFGYAMGRYYGKTDDDIYCKPYNTYFSSIPSSLDGSYVEGSDLNGIRGGDILLFGANNVANGHAAYVYSVPDPFDMAGIMLNQVSGPGANPETISIVHVMADQQDPIGYYRGFGLTVRVTFMNSYKDGTIKAFQDKNGSWRDIIQHGISKQFNHREHQLYHPLPILAEEEYIHADGIKRKFNRWLKNENEDNEISTNIEASYDLSEGSAMLWAEYMKEFEVEILTSHDDENFPGTIKFNNNTHTTPYLSYLQSPEDDNPEPIVEAINSQVHNGIIYHFDHWDDGNTQNPRVFNIDNNCSYTACFNAYRPEIVENVQIVSGFNEWVELAWDEQPDENIIYKIYRDLRDQVDPDNNIITMVATVPHGTTSWTDDIYKRERFASKLIKYDVRAYYTGEIEHNSAPVNWAVTIYGDTYDSKKKKAKETKTLKEQEYYTIKAYPNPFNSSTVISYHVSNPGYVSLKIYDISGKEVRTMAAGNQNSGSYNLHWNGTDNNNNSLPTGLYFYHFIVNSKIEPYSKNGKLLIVK